MSPAVPAPPARFPRSQDPVKGWRGRGKKKRKERAQAASSALNQNNYPEKCTAESARGEGERNAEATTSLQPLLVISVLLWKRSRASWEDATCSRQAGRQAGGRIDSRRKGPMCRPLPKKHQPLFGSGAAAAERLAAHMKDPSLTPTVRLHLVRRLLKP